MLSCGPVEVYQARQSLATDVCAGPGGLVLATLSVTVDPLTHLFQDSLSIWTISSGLSKVGSINLPATTSELHMNLDRQSRLIWNPSGEALACIVGGTLHYINLQWYKNNGDSLGTENTVLRFDDVVLKYENGNTDDSTFYQIQVLMEIRRSSEIMASTLCSIHNGRELVVGKFVLCCVIMLLWGA